MKIKITSLLLAFSMLFSFAGCKSGDNGEEGDVSSDTSESITEAGSELEPYGDGEEETDTTAPLILACRENVTVTKGELFSVDAYISYIDDYDSSPSVVQDGIVDTTVPGTYTVSVTISDDAGNSVSKTMTVNVVEPSTGGGGGGGGGGAGEEPNIQFSDFVANYGTEEVMLGIDVSKWQGDVDYEAVKAAGVDFVMIRAAVYYQEEFSEDSYFQQNLRNAKAAGLKVGIYYYSGDNTEELAREHARGLVKLINNEPLDFPIVYDWECWNRIQQYGISIKDLNCTFYAFCDELSKYGYEGMLYSSKYYLETIWRPRDHEVWLAHYTDHTSYEGNYSMWQVNCIGKIDGIDGYVDLDIYYPSHEGE